MFNVNWKQWCKTKIKIPIDEDARGIVVRMLDHKYYLHPWTLRFIDPYVNVEFQTYMRRIQLKRLRVVCFIALMIPFYIGIFTKKSSIPSEFAIDEFSRFNIDTILAAISISYLISLTGILVLIHSRAAYVVNVPVASACILCALISMQTILLSYSFDIQIPDTASTVIKKNNVPIWFGSAYNLLYRAFPMGTCMMCVYSCISVAVTVDIMTWYVVVAVVTLGQAFMLYEAHVVCGRDFSLLHEYFDAGITTRHIIGQMMNIPHDALILDKPAEYLPLAAKYITASLNAYVANSTAYTLDSHPLYQVLKIGLVTPYKSSVFDAASFDATMRKQTTIVWFMFVTIMTFVVYQYNRSMRTIFILTRVRSNKDAPRNLDGGIWLQELTEAHIGCADIQITSNNLAANKKSSSNTDSSGNECVDDSIKELDIMSSLEQLGWGDRLSQLGCIDEKTSPPNELASITSAGDSLLDAAMNIVPNKYTQSVGDDAGSAV